MRNHTVFDCRIAAPGSGNSSGIVGSRRTIKCVLLVRAISVRPVRAYTAHKRVTCRQAHQRGATTAVLQNTTDVAGDRARHI